MSEDKIEILEKAINQVIKENKELKEWTLRALNIKNNVVHSNNKRLRNIERYCHSIYNKMKMIEHNISDWRIPEVRELIKKFREELKELNFY